MHKHLLEQSTILLLLVLYMQEVLPFRIIRINIMSVINYIRCSKTNSGYLFNESTFTATSGNSHYLIAHIKRQFKHLSGGVMVSACCAVKTSNDVQNMRKSGGPVSSTFPFPVKWFLITYLLFARLTGAGLRIGAHSILSYLDLKLLTYRLELIGIPIKQCSHLSTNH